MSFSHQEHRRADGICVELSGEIDLSVREDLRRILKAAVATSPGNTNLDLRSVTFLDCGGIGEIVRGYLDAQSRRHTLTVTRSRGIVRRILELTDVLAMLTPPAGAPAWPAARTVAEDLYDLPPWTGPSSDPMIRADLMIPACRTEMGTPTRGTG